ncbi:L-alanine-DL-glutamate epimerase-like enolase superfamily enzyme [Gillisia mitskevichiae]|uniref:Dipeptide epimerase n=1 Tax=Gillisia mitskevichiae TaxID=270921 RepID=A0A495PW04_9FLAO|nr:dipeptide epimerase [Gillisia mitskevichiae]RKS55365.1 L-alanine-DL-glutamate epimerase-like enolase superfamily enzyme [Gillisia mitskevichiae]
MKIEFYTYNLELKNTFTISHGSRDFQETLIVALSEGEFTGYGEAAATVYYGVTTEAMIASIKSVETIVAENIHLKPEELWELTFPHLQDNPFAQCALDIAMHDLHGKRNKQPLYKLWGLNLQNIPLTNYTIGIDTVEKMVEKIKEFPWPLYKIKLGTNEDVQIVKELRKHTNSVFRVDANGAWTAEQTIKNSELLKDLNVEFLEQPLNPKDLDGMAEVYKNSALPIIADESCIVETDVAKCKDYFHGVNIKLTKCAGLTPARRMITEAKKLNMKVMVGCMTESTVGISAIAQLLPLLDYVDMDGALLLKSDIADGVKVYDEKVHFPDRNGTGAKLLIPE